MTSMPTAPPTQVSLRQITAEDPLNAPWLAEAAQAIAGRAAPCELSARLEAGDAGWWIEAETPAGRRIVGALSGRSVGRCAVWTWLAAAAEWRHYGFGGAAVPLFEQAVRVGGAARAAAPLPRDNGVALYFWLRLGYAPLREPLLSPGEVPPGVSADAVWMVRELVDS